MPIDWNNPGVQRDAQKLGYEAQGLAAQLDGGSTEQAAARLQQDYQQIMQAYGANGTEMFARFVQSVQGDQRQQGTPLCSYLATDPIFDNNGRYVGTDVHVMGPGHQAGTDQNGQPIGSAGEPLLPPRQNDPYHRPQANIEIARVPIQITSAYQQIDRGQFRHGPQGPIPTANLGDGTHGQIPMSTNPNTPLVTRETGLPGQGQPYYGGPPSAYAPQMYQMPRFRQ